MKRIIIIITVILSTNMIIHGSGKMMADIDCKGTNHKLVYDCMIKLSEMKTGNKINGAEFSVGADMPSMPDTHNLKPEVAHEMGIGMYKVNLNLEMFGEWTIKLDFKKPHRDMIVKKMTFGKKGMKIKHDDSEGHQHKKGMKMKPKDHNNG